MLHNILQLAEGKWPFLAFGAVFVFVGVAVWLKTFFDLVTNSRSRADGRLKPSYDFVFRALSLLGVTGWVGFALFSFLDTLVGADHHFTSEMWINMNWGVAALAAGTLNLFRYRMMMEGWRIEAENPNPLLRWLYRGAVQSYTNSSGSRAFTSRLGGLVFSLIGVAILTMMAWNVNHTSHELVHEIDQIVTALRTGIAAKV